MGFDVIFRVTLECNIWDFLAFWQEKYPLIEDELNVSPDYFFKGVKIGIDIFETIVFNWDDVYWDDDFREQNESMDLDSYIIHYLLEAHKQGKDYTSIFENDDTKVKDGILKFIIVRLVSYKGRDDVFLDFKSVAETIERYKKACPLLEQKTKLYYSC